MNATEVKHTPGPWKNYAKSAVGARTQDHDVKFVADCRTVDTEPEEQYANALLIAAAPELLELLKRYVESDSGIEDELTEEAAAAIAKAEGRSADA